MSTRNLVDDVITYECDAGFSLVGPITRVCQLSREWSNVAPTCEGIACRYVACEILLWSHNSSNMDAFTCYNFLFPEITCGPLPVLMNGMQMLSGTSVNDVIIYECDASFMLSGPMTRTCQLNGTWTDDDPTCEGIQSRTKGFFRAIFLDLFLIIFVKAF